VSTTPIRTWLAALGLGPKGTAEFLNNLAGEYDSKARDERRQEEQRMQKKTADELRRMAEEVVVSDGKHVTLLGV